MSVLTFCHSEKGGVGKSLAAKVLTDKLIYDGKKVIVLDADQSNADLHREFSNIKINEIYIEIYQYDLSQKNGWWDFYNLMAKNKDVEVNTFAKSKAALR